MAEPDGETILLKKKKKKNRDFEIPAEKEEPREPREPEEPREPREPREPGELGSTVMANGLFDTTTTFEDPNHLQGCLT